jgi:ribosomal protein S27AE
MVDYSLRSLLAVDAGKPVIDLKSDLPFVTGDGPNNYLCGKCRNILFKNVDIPHTRDIIVICGRCRTHNQIVV